MKKINNPDNLKIVLNKYRDLKSSSKIGYGREFINKIFLIEAIDESKYLKLGIKEGDFLFSLQPDKEMVNLRNSMHGGCVGTGLDIISTIAISGAHRDLNMNISTKLSLNFLLP